MMQGYCKRGWHEGVVVGMVYHIRLDPRPKQCINAQIAAGVQEGG